MPTEDIKSRIADSILASQKKIADNNREIDRNIVAVQNILDRVKQIEQEGSVANNNTNNSVVSPEARKQCLELLYSARAIQERSDVLFQKNKEEAAAISALTSLTEEDLQLITLSEEETEAEDEDEDIETLVENKNKDIETDVENKHEAAVVAAEKKAQEEEFNITSMADNKAEAAPNADENQEKKASGHKHAPKPFSAPKVDNEPKTSLVEELRRHLKNALTHSSVMTTLYTTVVPQSVREVISGTIYETKEAAKSTMKDTAKGLLNKIISKLSGETPDPSAENDVKTSATKAMSGVTETPKPSAKPPAPEPKGPVKPEPTSTASKPKGP